MVVVCSSELPVCGFFWFVFPIKPHFYSQVDCCFICLESSMYNAVAYCGYLSTVPNSLAWNLVGIFKMSCTLSMPNGVGAGSCLPDNEGLVHAQKLPLLVIPIKPFA